jgi:HD-GYP domain-containing protein (c-di-GMP phosphodiesterase class II)
LTVSFTLFGIFVGYAVFILLTIISTNAFIKLASETTRQYLSASSGGAIAAGQAELLGIIHRGLSDIINASAPLKKIFPSLKAELYCQENGKWLRTYADERGTIKSESADDKILRQSLESAKEKMLLTSSKFFYGAGDIVNVKINISPPTAKYPQIISFDIHRAGLAKMIKENIIKAVFFFIVLFFVSHTLAHLFSYFLARPIEKLAREATQIASGQYQRRFTTDRKDEIGRLAESLNIMASRIIDGTRERENILLGILAALTRAIDAKSPWTRGHSERVTKLADDLGRNLPLSEDQMRQLNISALLHDIGKIAVPEQILDKPGKLTDEEFAIVKKHPQTGADILSSIPSYETILPGILHHHERWDGTGYPMGLQGENIPLFARIICIADVYDALSEDRPYRRAWDKDQMVRFFEDQKGKMFDPELVDVFLKTIRA